jgi:hypothetical protein
MGSFRWIVLFQFFVYFLSMKVFWGNFLSKKFIWWSFFLCCCILFGSDNRYKLNRNQKKKKNSFHPFVCTKEWTTQHFWKEGRKLKMRKNSFVLVISPFLLWHFDLKVKNVRIYLWTTTKVKEMKMCLNIMFSKLSKKMNATEAFLQSWKKFLSVHSVDRQKAALKNESPKVYRLCALKLFLV